MSSAYAVAELERLLANLVRVGVVAALDEVGARVTVDLGEVVTDWLPWVTHRAGATRTWSAPRPGEQVLVLAPYGDLAQAVALPAIYQEAHPAPATAKEVEHVVFPDGSTVDYDNAAHRLTVTVGSGQVIVNCGQATINATQAVTLNTPQTTCTGALTVEGPFTYQAGMTGAGASSIAGDLAVAGGLANQGVNVGAGHVHSGVEPGEKLTGGPQ
ncbi:MAG: phage baseplate assembly protein V [Lautropia sp.]|nr:phage baseplate assembly protein V [Lautropia sp.]